MNQRLKEVRSALGLTQQEFADKIGTLRVNIAGYETGKRSPSSSVISLICEKCNVNGSWLKTGKGDMFNELPEEDEVAAYVSQLLDPDNDFLDLIVEIMRTYSQLDPKSQEVLLEFSRKLKENIKKED